MLLLRSLVDIKKENLIGLHVEARQWRTIWQKFSFLLLIAVSAFLLLLSKADLRIIEFASSQLHTMIAPVVGFVQKPISSLRQGADLVGEMIAVHEHNQNLKSENLVLRSWKARAVHLDVENRALREQLGFPRTNQTPSWITARIIADSTSAFMHTRLIAFGADAGLIEGMAAVDENGLAGRLIHVGQATSRLLLITDFNSKIPVMIASSKDRAILAGDNGPLPKLEFLPLDPKYRIGDLVITSGHGGLLPQGIPVGVISATVENKALVRPFADWSRLDHVTVLVERRLPTPEEAPKTSEPDEVASVAPGIGPHVSDQPIPDNRLDNDSR